MRIYQHLSGAHFILTQESSLAARTYYASDIERIEKRDGESVKSIDGTHPGDVDSVASFAGNFKWSVIFLILPIELMQLQLANQNSFLHRVTHQLDRKVMCRESRTTCTGNSHHNASSQTVSQRKTPPRIFCVTTTDEAMECLITYTDAISPHRCRKRQEYFERQRVRHFCCSLDTTNETSNIEKKRSVVAAASCNVARAIRHWADRYGLPRGEADVLMRVMGTLSSLACADTSTLQNTPIDDRSKSIIQSFFNNERILSNEIPDKESDTGISVFLGDPILEMPLCTSSDNEESFRRDRFAATYPIDGDLARSTSPGRMDPVILDHTRRDALFGCGAIYYQNQQHRKGFAHQVGIEPSAFQTHNQRPQQLEYISRNHIPREYGTLLHLNEINSCALVQQPSPQLFQSIQRYAMCPGGQQRPAALMQKEQISTQVRPSLYSLPSQEIRFPSAYHDPFTSQHQQTCGSNIVRTLSRSLPEERDAVKSFPFHNVSGSYGYGRTNITQLLNGRFIAPNSSAHGISSQTHSDFQDINDRRAWG